MDNSDHKDKPRPEPRKPRKATPRSLENAAHYHLQRFATSSENLRRVLGRRVDRSARAHDTDRAEGLAAVDEIIARFERAGLLNDTVYAAARAASLNRHGISQRAIHAKLREKGLSANVIEAAIEALAKNHAEPEFAAAAAYARRRRLGPYRPAEARTERRERDLGAMARSGFGYDLSLRVIDAEDVDALEEDVSGNS
ncbi:MAG: RecX family transcriptional regulator [Rhodospirillaceae bacterium]|nr:RecX family transcriptional regulator [Rhodospirillaceae bacterium]MBT4749955.1 RecX family transcriptional regulator [Rhodospirillaceae bacterium]MBT6289619.1 RecX family transcriptional regulator [Rhodospirillaceae bacterium]MBT6860541.1 RecX family transcriptional regulator [Rhodospirillaceae bacterium]MBT7234804.1 RecX family transcriptional regulator [Rhodospirillaceae bacterium]